MSIGFIYSANYHKEKKKTKHKDKAIDPPILQKKKGVILLISPFSISRTFHSF